MSTRVSQDWSITTTNKSCNIRADEVVIEHGLIKLHADAVEFVGETMSRLDNLLEGHLLGDLSEPPHRSCAISRAKRDARSEDLSVDPCLIIGSRVVHSEKNGAASQPDQALGWQRSDARNDDQPTPDKLNIATRQAATLEGTSQAYDDQSKQQWVAAMLRSPFQFDCRAKCQTINVSDIGIDWSMRSGAAINSRRFQRQTELESFEGVGLVWPTQFNTTSWAFKKRLQFEEL